MGASSRKAATQGAGAAAAAAVAPELTDPTEVEELGLAAFRLRESDEFRSAKRHRPRQGEAWDMVGCTPEPPTSTARTAAAPGTAEGAAEAAAGAAAPTSSYLEGSVAVGIVIVDGPGAQAFTAAERTKVVAEVQNGLGYFASVNPIAGISFTYDVRHVTLTLPANPSAADLEGYWRDPAMAALGYSADWSGVRAYVEHIRTQFGTTWAYCGFFTKYPLPHFAFASIGGPRLVMDYNNDGWGPDNIDRVFAHETGHVFGCPDEYAASGCDCGGSWGRFGLPNSNCENCAPEGGVPCLMRSNTFGLCLYTPGHLGWAPKLVINDLGYNAGGWRVDQHPRFLADTDGDGRADIVGFGNAGVLVSRSLGGGAFEALKLVINDFGYNAGGWRVDRHPRFLADTTGDGKADVVGFGDAGVYVSRSLGGGTFEALKLVIGNFGQNAGGWRVDRHPRLLADTTGDGRADVVGFGDAGVYVSRSLGGGTFTAPQLVISNFGHNAGGWRVDRHPRFLADTTGDRCADVVGFGDAGVYVSLSLGNGTFSAPQLAISDFGYNSGWRVDRHPRFLADTSGDGRADVVGFGDAGVYVSRSLGGGTFEAPKLVISNFGYNAGGWRVDRHPRFLADTTGDGRADVVGFGDAGVYVSRSLASGTFESPKLVVGNFAYTAGGWRVDRHPRLLADTTGDGKADIVGFGDAGVYLSGLWPSNLTP
ncbi:FG-GAP repeat domain-containing protein [Actinomycetospora aeridis]|uniref:FG-GAP-like repeat-containing protein n=1 Tax=Actinomycetospora aeridis TaxID=3129231 RepID=A0ABU8NB76_9PSEU